MSLTLISVKILHRLLWYLVVYMVPGSIIRRSLQQRLCLRAIV
jgi:hypothetical protein